ncbi:hypothetical protein TWF481_009819 [Arthrobotrys musiformis]|uniref:Uncharacterized protein n=1 Tax=Arthrobotrys musiformis TaxID=47236 RepID=A0AAV9W6X5_9PEZI
MRRTKTPGGTLRAAALLLGWWVSTADSYYFAAVRSNPTRPQGLPVWGWQPLGAADDMGCKTAGSQQLGWLQAFGVINQQTPPPGWPNGNAEGFIFYTDANCRIEQSEKVLYVKFDPNSASPQFANLRNLAWEVDEENTMSLADNKYQSYREVRANNGDLQRILPQQVQLPATYVYPAQQYAEDGGPPTWGGEVMADGVTRLNVLPPQQGTQPNPRATVFDALLSLMSGLGHDLATQQQLTLYADESLRILGMPGMPLNVGSYKASPSKVLDFNTIDMSQSTPNYNFNLGLNQGTGMNVEPQDTTAGTGTMARINLPLYGDTDINQPIGRGRRTNRFNHPYFEDEESEPQSDRIVNEPMSPLNLENFEALDEQFDPSRIMLSLMTKWETVLQENEIVRSAAVRRYDQNEEDLDTRDRLRESVQLMANGMEWIENVQATTKALVEAQNQLLEALQELEDEHKAEAEVYQRELDSIQRFRTEYESTFIPSQEDTARYEASNAQITQAQELYDGAVETLESQYQRYSWDFRQNEEDFYNYYLKVFRYLRNLEIRLRVLKDELGLGEDSPVIIYGVPDDDTGNVYHPPSSYNEQIELINIGGGDDLNVAQNYEERKEQSEEGEEIEFQQEAINSSPEGSGEVVSYMEGTNVNPEATDFDPNSLQDPEDQI